MLLSFFAYIQKIFSSNCARYVHAHYYIIYVQDGYREREDRITKLEIYINEQVAELDKTNAKLKQTLVGKEQLRKQFQVRM